MEKTLVQLNDVELAVTVKGTGRPLLFVHGFPLSRRMWEAQVDAFAATHHVIAPDLRGFGESGVATSTLAMEGFADDLNAMLDAMRITDRVVFCGLSMGGYVAFAFANKYRDRLSGLVLADTRAQGDTEESAKNRVALAERVLAEGPAPLVDGMLGKLFAERTKRENSQLVDQVHAIMNATPVETLAAASRGMAVRRDWTQQLDTFDVPSLVVVGSGDVISPPDEMRAIADTMPDCEYVEITTAGHMSPMEDPAAFNRALRAFLDRLS